MNGRNFGFNWGFAGGIVASLGLWWFAINFVMSCAPMPLVLA